MLTWEHHGEVWHEYKGKRIKLFDDLYTAPVREREGRHVQNITCEITQVETGEWVISFDGVGSFGTSETFDHADTLTEAKAKAETIAKHFQKSPKWA